MIVDTSTATPKIQGMFGTIAKNYDFTNTILSMGVHHLWKRALVRNLPQIENGIALDLCTGTGDLLPLLKRKFAKVYGADFCLPMLKVAIGKLKSSKLSAQLIGADAARLPFCENQFDSITVAFGVRNFENLRACLKETRRILKRDGTLAILEFGQPCNPIFNRIYQLYSKYLMPIIGGLLTGNRTAYEYLPQTAAKFPCGLAFESVLRECGFSPIKTLSCFGGIAYIYVAKLH